MTTATITYLGDLRTECTHTASGNTITTDAPVDNRGKGQAFSPTDICATSLAACALTIMGMYAADNNLDISGATADVTKVMGIAPRRISKIEIAFHMPARNFSDADKAALVEQFKSCPVCHSLHPDIEKAITFHWK